MHASRYIIITRVDESKASTPSAARLTSISIQDL